MSPTKAIFLEQKQMRISNKREESCGPLCKQLLRLAPFESADASNTTLNLVVALLLQITGWWSVCARRGSSR